MRASRSRSVSSSPARAAWAARQAVAISASFQAMCARRAASGEMEEIEGIRSCSFQTYFLKAATVVDSVAATSTVNTSTM